MLCKRLIANCIVCFYRPKADLGTMERHFYSTLSEGMRTLSVSFLKISVMENLDKRTLLELASQAGEHCISVYLPTHRKGHEVNEGYDLILFKNHVQKVRAELQQRGLKSHEVEDLLSPLNELLREKEFWKDQREGLAVFRSPSYFDYFQSPISFDEFSQVNHRFYATAAVATPEQSENVPHPSLDQKPCILV